MIYTDDLYTGGRTLKTKLILTCFLLCLLGSCALFDFDNPVVTILSPADGETVPALITVTGTVTDQGGIRSVNIRIDDGVYKAVEGLGEWQYICTLTSGRHILTVSATDYNAHTSYSRITITVDTAL